MTLHLRRPNDMTTGTKTERVSSMRKNTRRFLSYLLMGLVILSIGTSSNLGVAFGDSLDVNGLGGGHGDHGDWDKSSLSFVGQDGTCELISATVMNGQDSRDMGGTTTWKLYWIASGNPKDGVVIKEGTLPALSSGETYTITYNPAENSNGPDGVYMFMANQRPDHPGTGVLWSGAVALAGCVLETPTGTLTVNKTFSNPNANEVTVVLYEVTESGDVEVASQATVDHTTTFAGLDLEKSYKIAESSVPSGYEATYPDGQSVIFNKDHTSTLGILNNLIPVDPEKGSLNITKAYSNGNDTEVTVELYKVTGEGDVLVGTHVTVGLATTFNNLDIESTYKIVEAPVPSGYSVSYPGGQTKGISGTEAESLSILNTLVPVDNPGGGGTTPTPGTPTPGAPAVTTTTTTTTTTVDRDRADRAVETIPSEATPLSAPVIVPETPTAVPDEIIPLGVPMLPKTGELPAAVFYGLGGMLTAVGAFLKRK